MKMKGFTLVETLIAIAIMMIAIAGPMYTASRAILAADIARDQLTASYLAQEGIEYVRAVRDNWYLSAYQVGSANVSGTAWTSFLAAIDPACVAPNVCAFDPVNGGSLQTCLGGACSALSLIYNGITNVYTQSPGMTQIIPGAAFIRTIQATNIPPNEEKIVSKVLWYFHGTQYSVTITDHLTPWQ